MGSHTRQGLSAAEAAARLAAEGPNALPGRQQRSVWHIAWEVVREPMFLLLVAGAGIYLLLGDVHEALFLGAAVVVSCSSPSCRNGAASGLWRPCAIWPVRAPW